MEFGASGIIFAFVVILWAAYVLPLALRRYDESDRKLQVGSAGSFSRVIGRSRRASGDAAVVTSVPAPAKDTMRPAYRRAARRRRYVLYTTLLPVVGLMIAGALSYLPLWSAAVALLVPLAWLVLCRFQVKIERKLTGGRASRSIRADYEATIIVSNQVEDLDAGNRHVMERDVALESDALVEKLQIAVPSTSVGGGVQWDPLPVTVPTYVTKPRAGRTVRTIDFDQAGTWTSGHVEGEQTELPLSGEAPGDGHQHAVGH